MMVTRHLMHLCRDSIPSRASLESNRFIRPVAHRVLASELWRFNRRSVPRGVALGLLVGIFFLIPGVQMAGAALLAMPIRANVPIAVAMTFLSNPATTPLIVALSLYIGNGMLGRQSDLSHFMAMLDRHASLSEWTGWLVSEAAPSLVFGLFVIAVVVAAAGYLISGLLWRLHSARRWARRQGAGSGTGN